MSCPQTLCFVLPRKLKTEHRELLLCDLVLFNVCFTCGTTQDWQQSFSLLTTYHSEVLPEMKIQSFSPHRCKVRLQHPPEQLKEMGTWKMRAQKKKKKPTTWLHTFEKMLFTACPWTRQGCELNLFISFLWSVIFWRFGLHWRSCMEPFTSQIYWYAEENAKCFFFKETWGQAGITMMFP